MKKNLDIEYMRRTLRNALKIKSGLRVGKHDKPKPTPKYGFQALYGVAVPE